MTIFGGTVFDSNLAYI